MSAIEDLASYIHARTPSETPEGERTTWDELTEQQRDIYRAHARNAAITFPDQHPEAAAETRTQMTDDVTDRARAALEGVTRGPWTVVSGAWGNVWHFPEGDHNDGRPTVVVRMGGMTEADSTFIAASRSLVPELLAEVERLRGDKQLAEAELAMTQDGFARWKSRADAAEAEVERLRGALKALAHDLNAHNQTTPDDEDHEIICDVESTIAYRIEAVLRGDR